MHNITPNLLIDEIKQMAQNFQQHRIEEVDLRHITRLQKNPGQTSRKQAIILA
jgi:hypothetical protein